jgi:hypothetical protein
MDELDASLLDRKMRAAVLIIGLACIGAGGGTVFHLWPVFSLYPVLIAVAGGVMLACLHGLPSPLFGQSARCCRSAHGPSPGN